MSNILRLEKNGDLKLFHKLIDLADDDSPTLQNLLENLGVESVNDLMGYDLLLNGEASKVRFKNYSVYTDDESGLRCETFLFVKGGVVYACDNDLRFDIVMNNHEALTSHAPVGIILDTDLKLRKDKGIETPKIRAIANADEFDSHDELTPIRSLVGEFSYSKFPETSFRCLSRFYMKKSESAAMKKVIAKLKSGDLEILDYIENDSIDLTSSEAKEYETNKLIQPPKAGYSIVGEYYKYWHRPATVVFYDWTEDMYILCGQDDDSYFGVELPKRASTVNQAFKVLMPKEVSKSAAFLRQGEWFMIPHNENDVPSEQDAVLNIVDAEEQVFLPREPEGSRHFIDGGDIRISKTGTVYARNFNLCHENGDHPTVEMDDNTWYSFHCNTAVRSFSVEGVD